MIPRLLLPLPLAGLLCLVAAAAGAALLPGDLDGDGAVGASDESWLERFYGTSADDGNYDPAADLDANGTVDVRDLARFGAAFGQGGGEVDTTPPTLRVTLNDIPDDMDDLLVVPPDRFQITLHYDSAGGAVVDPDSLVVVNTLAIGAEPGYSNLAPHFAAGATRAVWEVPAGSDLARTTHALIATVRDAAGNAVLDTYGYAVRDFAYGIAPLGSLQRIHLDFDQDRNLGPDVDFLEDLRSYGLSLASAPVIETRMRDRLVSEIVGRTHGYYGRSADGSPGTDAANVLFSATPPAAPYSRLCVGGQSSQGAIFLGAAFLDLNNVNQASDECARGLQFGVFPQAIRALWPANPHLLAAFDPLDAAKGGTPVGADPLDDAVTTPGFDPATASPAEQARHAVIENAVDAFAQGVATAVAHETGHMLGLVAHGPAPGGLWGGTAGGTFEHNVATGGGTPVENFVMNAGGSFSFQELTGRAGKPLPVFRPLNWAYLRDRVVLDARVTGLFPPPTVSAIEPNPVVVPPGGTATVTFHGTGFLAQPAVQLRIEGDPTPNALLAETLLDPETFTAVVNAFLVPPGLYDVELTNADGQVLLLPDFLEVQ